MNSKYKIKNLNFVTWDWSRDIDVESDRYEVKLNDSERFPTHTTYKKCNNMILKIKRYNI